MVCGRSCFEGQFSWLSSSVSRQIDVFEDRWCLWSVADSNAQVCDRRLGEWAGVNRRSW